MVTNLCKTIWPGLFDVASDGVADHFGQRPRRPHSTERPPRNALATVRGAGREKGWGGEGWVLGRRAMIICTFAKGVFVLAPYPSSYILQVEAILNDVMLALVRETLPNNPKSKNTYILGRAFSTDPLEQ